MKKIFLILSVFLYSISFSQSLNSYEYLIIPSKFEFQKTENQYGLNSLVEAYFKQQGFQSVFDKNITKEMNNNRCKSIYADIVRENSMFSTKIKVIIKDCEGKQLLISSEGSSRSKEYEVAHKEAMRMALKSLPNQNYVFKESQNQNTSLSEVKPQEATTIGKIDNQKSPNMLVVETLSSGFLFIDSSSSKIFLKLYNTASKDIFIATSTTKNGIVTRQKNKIIFEYIFNNVVTNEVLNVQF